MCTNRELVVKCHFAALSHNSRRRRENVWLHFYTSQLQLECLSLHFHNTSITNFYFIIIQQSLQCYKYNYCCGRYAELHTSESSLPHIPICPPAWNWNMFIKTTDIPSVEPEGVSVEMEGDFMIHWSCQNIVKCNSNQPFSQINSIYIVSVTTQVLEALLRNPEHNVIMAAAAKEERREWDYRG